MRSLFKAFGIVFIVCLALFLIMKAASLNNTDAAKLALTPFSAITLVHSKIESRTSRQNEQGKLQTFSDFSYPFWKVLVLAALSAVALIEFMSVVSMLVTFLPTVGSSTPGGIQLFRLVAIASVPTTLYVMFAVGRWIGVRAKKSAFLAAVLVGLFCRVFDTGLSLTLMSRTEFREVYSIEKTDIGLLAVQIMVGVVLFGSFCMLGCWAGRRHRQALYLDHLLKSVAPEVRDTIIDLAYEEAQRTVSGSSSRVARSSVGFDHP